MGAALHYEQEVRPSRQNLAAEGLRGVWRVAEADRLQVADEAVPWSQPALGGVGFAVPLALAGGPGVVGCVLRADELGRQRQGAAGAGGDDGDGQQEVEVLPLVGLAAAAGGPWVAADLAGPVELDAVEGDQHMSVAARQGGGNEAVEHALAVARSTATASRLCVRHRIAAPPMTGRQTSDLPRLLPSRPASIEWSRTVPAPVA